MPKAIAQSSSATGDRILAAAGELIASKGWAALSTRAVASRAGLNQALVHYHFDSIEALGLVALKQAFAAEAGEAIEVVLAHADLADGLRAFGRWLAGSRDTAARRRVIVEALSQATLREELRGFLLAALAGWRRELAARIPGDRRDADAVAHAIAAALDGIVIHDMLDPEFDAVAVLDVVARLVEAR